MVVGDSAFGFSGMEVETAIRYNLPIKVVIINNNGIGLGFDKKTKEHNAVNLPVNALNPESQYEKISTAFGGKGAEVSNHDDLAKTM